MTPILTAAQQAQQLQDEIDALRRIAVKQKEFFRKYPHGEPMDYWDWGYGVLPTGNFGTLHFEITPDGRTYYKGRSNITTDSPPQKKLIVVDTSKDSKADTEDDHYFYINKG